MAALFVVEIVIRPAVQSDADAIWAAIAPVIQAGDTYALPTGLTRQQALDYWMGPDRETFVAEAGGVLLGTYYLKANQAGGGSHVANCGYITAPAASGKGVARQMCAHSLQHARARGFRAMQFNLVVSTNTRAVALWQAMGFRIVGTLPGAFAHPRHGDVDAFVLFQAL
jgi:ribosomal protein S18 acetylase RimI-like enzyme